MIGGLRGRPVANSTGPGTPIPIPRTSAALAADLAEQRVEALVDPVEHRLGPGGDLDVAASSASDRAAEVGDREARVGGAEVGGEHDAGAPR